MKQSLILVFLLLIMLNCGAYTISHYTKTFYDASRSRNIQTEIFYPVNAANPDETFPYIVFGHGWLVSYSYTQALTDVLVNLGWIVALPTTEGSLFPSHQNFALDLSFLQGAVFAENSSPASLLYDKIQPLAVVGGYSMGGGCAIVAASYNPNFMSVVTFAATETNPSAINAALNVTVPSVTFSGSSDTIAPPGTHQIPIYNNLASVYKAHVTINGSTHTNLFSNSLIAPVLEPWLSYLKTGSHYYLQAMENVLAANAGSLTRQIVNNLIPLTPDQIELNLSNESINLSWDIVYLVTGYRIFASDDPASGFTDVSSEGSFEWGNRITWSCAPAADPRRFFRITAYRN